MPYGSSPGNLTYHSLCAEGGQTTVEEHRRDLANNMANRAVLLDCAKMLESLPELPSSPSTSHTDPFRKQRKTWAQRRELQYMNEVELVKSFVRVHLLLAIAANYQYRYADSVA